MSSQLEASRHSRHTLDAASRSAAGRGCRQRRSRSPWRCCRCGACSGAASPGTEPPVGISARARARRASGAGQAWRAGAQLEAWCAEQGTGDGKPHPHAARRAQRCRRGRAIHAQCQALQHAECDPTSTTPIAAVPPFQPAAPRAPAQAQTGNMPATAHALRPRPIACLSMFHAQHSCLRWGPAASCIAG